MNRLDCSTVFIARFTLEAATALSVSTGNPDGVFDTALVRDANGLPAQPGSSLAGVLRHLWIETHGDDESAADDLFGYQKRKHGEASRLLVSWGALLDSQGRPAEGLITESQRLEDELYKAVLDQQDTPVYRDRVRLTHRGAAADKAKFDRAVLPAGHRFAVELKLWADSPESGQAEWNALLSLLRHPAFRLGGNTRAGLGKMRLIELHQGCFDLENPEQRRHYAQLGRGLADTKMLQHKDIEPPSDSDWISGELVLEAKGPWRIGQGNESLCGDNGDKPADLLPKTEECIIWEDGKGQRQLKMPLVPASSIKGALAHRIAFHYRRHVGEWNSEDATLDDQRPESLHSLLGWIKDSKDGNETGRAGALILDDISITLDKTQVIHLMHNAIDRFTGGVRNRMLFDEESLFGGQLTIPIALKKSALENAGPEVRQALSDALDDLCQGRLAIGSKTSTGNGFFTGEMKGPLADWLSETDKPESNEEAA